GFVGVANGGRGCPGGGFGWPLGRGLRVLPIRRRFRKTAREWESEKDHRGSLRKIGTEGFANVAPMRDSRDNEPQRKTPERAEEEPIEIGEYVERNERNESQRNYQPQDTQRRANAARPNPRH